MAKARGSSRHAAPAPREAAAGRRRHAGDGDAWVLQCAPGLARVLQAELRARKLQRRGERLDVLWQRNHDLLFTPRLQRAPDATSLRTAERIERCLIYGRFKISDSQLDRLAGRLRADGGWRRLVVTAEGRHFNRFDLGRWLGRELARRGARLDDGAAAALVVHCVDQAFYVCLPAAHGGEAAGRVDRQAEREGSLPPTIAAAMAFLGRPADDDVVLDPVCGSGTLLAEAAAYAPNARLHGIDSDPRAVKTARKNLARAGTVSIAHGDARACELAPGRVSLVLANLPFGKQFGDPATNRALYHDLLAEMRRLAAPARWRAVLLSADAELLAEAAAAAGLRVRRRLAIRVRGEPATIVVLARE